MTRLDLFPSLGRREGRAWSGRRGNINRKWYKDLKNPPLTFLRSSKPYFDRITMRALKKLWFFFKFANQKET
jgi:hypothetical protein